MERNKRQDDRDGCCIYNQSYLSTAYYVLKGHFLKDVQTVTKFTGSNEYAFHSSIVGIVMVTNIKT